MITPLIKKSLVRKSPVVNGLLVKGGSSVKPVLSIPFTQPVLVRDGTLGGNDFAVSASAIYGTGYEAFRSFDHVSGTAWGVTEETDFPCDLIMYYPDAFNITSLRWQVLNYNRQLKDWELYGSNDGTNYTLIDSGTCEASNDVTLNFNYSGYYKYYKLKVISGYNGINAKEITLTGTVKRKTEMTFAAPYLTSSGTLGGDSFAVLGDAFSNYYDWQIFADNANSGATKTWAYNSSSANYIFYNPDALKVSSLDIVNRNESTPRPIKSGTVYGSNDGTNWTELATFTNDITSKNASWSIDVNSDTYYKYHKINCVSIGSYVGIGKLIIHATYRP